MTGAVLERMERLADRLGLVFQRLQNRYGMDIATPPRVDGRVAIAYWTPDMTTPHPNRARRCTSLRIVNLCVGRYNVGPLEEQCVNRSGALYFRHQNGVDDVDDAIFRLDVRLGDLSIAQENVRPFGADRDGASVERVDRFACRHGSGVHASANDMVLQDPLEILFLLRLKKAVQDIRVDGLERVVGRCEHREVAFRIIQRARQIRSIESREERLEGAGLLGGGDDRFCLCGSRFCHRMV